MRTVVCIVALLFALGSVAQETTKSAEARENKGKETAAEPSNQKDLKNSEPNALIGEEKIPSGARVYIAAMANGFDNYIAAALQQKKVQLVVVADRNKAEYEITGIAETDKAGWAKMLFIGSQQTNETASVKMVNLSSGAIVFAYSVNKVNSVRGKQSAAEACAKHIKAKIVG